MRNHNTFIYLQVFIATLFGFVIKSQAIPGFENDTASAVPFTCYYSANGYVYSSPTNIPVNVAVQTNLTLASIQAYYPPLPYMSTGTFSVVYGVGASPIQATSYPSSTSTNLPMGAFTAQVSVSGESQWLAGDLNGLSMHYYGTSPVTNNPQFTGLNATTCQCSSQDYQNMAGYVFKSLTATLGVYDEPLAYSPPVGNPIGFLIAYNSGEAYQPASPAWSNLGPKWNINAVSYLQDSGNQWTNQVNITSITPTNSGFNLLWYAPTNDIFRVQFTASLSPANWQTFSNVVPYTGSPTATNGQFTFFDDGSQYPFTGMRFYRIYISGLQTDVTNTVRVFQPGGGSELYTGYNPLTATFAVSPYSQTTLSRPSGNTYQVTYLNGSSQTYTITNGNSPRQVFMSAATDPQGNSTKYNYNRITAGLQLTQVIDAIGQTNTLGYTNSDPLKITSITDPFGHTATFGYMVTNGALQLISSTDPAGIQSQYSYSTNNLITKLTTPYGPTTFVYSNATGFAQITATDPMGGTERVASIAQATNINVGALPAGMLLDTNWTGYRNTYYWTKEAYAVSTALTNTQVTHWAGIAGQAQDTPLFVKNQLQANAKWYNYPGQTNAWGDSITFNEPALTGLVVDNGSNQVVTASYDQFGNLTNSIDPLGRVSRFTYASNGVDLLKVQQGADTTAQFTYNSQHLPVVAVVNGITNQMAYTTTGLLLAITNGLDQVTTFSYNGTGYLTNITGHLPSATLNLTYNTNGQLYTVTDSDGYVITNTYDALNRLTNSALPDGTWIAQVYTNLSLVGIQSQNQLWTRLAYNANQQNTDITNQAGLDYHYDYCTCGALTGIVDPKLQPTTWTRDVQSRPTAKTYANSLGSTLYYQTNQSLVASTTDANNHTTTISYNLDNTVSNITYTVGTPSVSLFYDTNYVRLTSWIDGQGTNYLSYIPAGQPAAGSIAAITNPYPATIQYQYDVLGRNNQTAIGTNIVNLGYDALSRITAETNVLGVTTVSYVNASGRPDAESLPNGLGVAFSYTPVTNQSLLKSMVVTNSAGTVVERYDYTYDIRNLIITQTNLIGGVTNAWSYGYDLSEQLTNAVQLTNGVLAHTYAYGYDAAGNRTNVTIDGIASYETANNVNQLTNKTPSTLLTYDAQGNELSRSNSTRLLQMGYDGANRCVAITNGTLTTQIQYDGFNHWVRITDYNGATMTDDRRFIWNGNTLAEERDATGTNVTKRFFSNGFQQNGTNYYYLKDNLGSIREVTDASGNVVARFSYDPYGNRTQTAGTLQVDYGFAGLFEHSQSGLKFAVYRFYDPTTGRWINRDPIGEQGGWNLYAYCGNDSVNFIDVGGLDSVLVLSSTTAIKRFGHQVLTTSIFSEGARFNHIIIADNLADVSLQLDSLSKQHIDITELTILGHGLPGSQQFGNDEIATDGNNGLIWKAIADHVNPKGLISLAGCNVGQDQIGANYIKALAAAAHRSVLAFTGPVYPIANHIITTGKAVYSNGTDVYIEGKKQ